MDASPNRGNAGAGSAVARAPSMPSKDSTSAAIAPVATVAYETNRGSMLCGKAEEILTSKLLTKYHRKVQLIFTSPPFPLNRKKKYGNRQGEEYVKWLASLAPIFKRFLKKDGSIVMEMGNAWEPGKPVMSTLALRALIGFLDEGGLQLCQQFIVHNPTRLPGPAQWVNVERIRVKDSFTHVWWMSASDRPKADNRRVLKQYSAAMLNLLARQKYNSGKRPSEHHIGDTSFLKNNNGAIPPNVLTLSNTSSSNDYLKYCREHDLQPHPARMSPELPAFFIKFLTTQRNLVMDTFAGSNVTGAVAENLKRRWIAIESRPDYIDGSQGRFSSSDLL